MTTGRLRPWSQVDDEAEAAIAVDVPSSPEQEARPQPPDTAASAGHPAWWGRLRDHMTLAGWALVPIMLAAGWTAWSAIHTAGDTPAVPSGYAVGVISLLLFSTGLMVAGWSAQRATLTRLCADVLRTGTRAAARFDTGRADREFGPLWSAIDTHISAVDAQLADLIEQQRELSLDRSVAHMQKRHTAAIIDSIFDAVFVTDAFDQLLLANPAAASIFGFDRAAAFRQPIAEILHDEALLQAIRQVRESDGRNARRCVEHAIGDRTYALTLSNLSDERDSGQTAADGGSNAGPRRETQGVVAVLRDITKDRQAARLKSDFVSQVSHELRTPLSSIRAYVEMLVDGEAADETTRDEYYDIIQTSADRLGRLIDNLLNISRIEAGTVRINKEPVALSMVVKEALDIVRPQAEERHLELTEELTPVMYRIHADRDTIHRAVLNLLSNAIKYTPEGGKVHLKVEAHEEDHTISIAVKDTGVGIPTEDLPHMFEKFYRVAANAKMARGTGLGLNLVKHIVETVHGGKMKLSSEVGRGSTFTMILPLMS